MICGDCIDKNWRQGICLRTKQTLTQNSRFQHEQRPGCGGPVCRDDKSGRHYTPEQAGGETEPCNS